MWSASFTIFVQFCLYNVYIHNHKNNRRHVIQFCNAFFHVYCVTHICEKTRTLRPLKVFIWIYIRFRKGLFTHMPLLCLDLKQKLKLNLFQQTETNTSRCDFRSVNLAVIEAYVLIQRYDFHGVEVMCVISNNSPRVIQQ